MAKRSVEPLPWLLFSAGGVASASSTPVLLLLFGLAFPLGWISPPSYEDISGLLRNPLTKLVLLGVFAVSLFHWAHRFRYTLYDGLPPALKPTIAVCCWAGPRARLAGRGIPARRRAAGIGARLTACVEFGVRSELGELGEWRDDAHLLSAEVDHDRLLSLDLRRTRGRSDHRETRSRSTQACTGVVSAGRLKGLPERCRRWPARSASSRTVCALCRVGRYRQRFRAGSPEDLKLVHCGHDHDRLPFGVAVRQVDLGREA